MDERVLEALVKAGYTWWGREEFFGSDVEFAVEEIDDDDCGLVRRADGSWWDYCLRGGKPEQVAGSDEEMLAWLEEE